MKRYDFNMDEKELLGTNDFIPRDIVTGLKGRNPLNQKKLTKYELDSIFNCIEG